jgi:hypothetical protein
MTPRKKMLDAGASSQHPASSIFFCELDVERELSCAKRVKSSGRSNED